jgi:hypothetical protein
MSQEQVIFSQEQRRTALRTLVNAIAGDLERPHGGTGAAERALMDDLKAALERYEADLARRALVAHLPPGPWVIERVIDGGGGDGGEQCWQVRAANGEVIVEVGVTEPWPAVAHLVRSALRMYEALAFVYEWYDYGYADVEHNDNCRLTNGEGACDCPNAAVLAALREADTWRGPAAAPWLRKNWIVPGEKADGT